MKYNRLPLFHKYLQFVTILEQSGDVLSKPVTLGLVQQLIVMDVKGLNTCCS